MSEPKPTYNTDPEAPEHQIAAHLYMVMLSSHEAGLRAQRLLQEMNALPDGKKLFTTRKERRRGMPE